MIKLAINDLDNTRRGRRPLGIQDDKALKSWRHNKAYHLRQLNGFFFSNSEATLTLHYILNMISLNPDPLITKIRQLVRDKKGFRLKSDEQGIRCVG